MKRRSLLAFHFSMMGVYAIIILAWWAGWARLSMTAWLVALVICAGGLSVCGVLLALVALRTVSRLFGERKQALPRHGRMPRQLTVFSGFDREDCSTNEIACVNGQTLATPESCDTGLDLALFSSIGAFDTPKYELTNESVTLSDGVILRRIRALRDFGDGPGAVRKGDLGGFIEAETNLSHHDTAWVYDVACVYGSARITEDAQVAEKALVNGSVLLLGNSQVFGRAQVGGTTRMLGNAQVCGNAEVYGALITENGCVCDAVIRGNVLVRGNTQLYCNTKPDVSSQEEGQSGVA